MRYLVTALTLVLLLMFVGCGKTESDDASSATSQPADVDQSSDDADDTDDDSDEHADDDAGDDDDAHADDEDSGVGNLMGGIADSVSDALADAKSIIKVNLNNATREAFLALPEVTERMAHEFDEYRPYVSIQQFRKEIGKYVDAEQVARYEKYVYVPIAFNDCDAATLQQIPGLAADAAKALIAARPFESAEAFIAALGDHVDAAATEIARSYLADE